MLSARPTLAPETTAMSGRTPLFALAALFVATTARAAEGPLDLAPDDAAFGVVIRNLADAKKKGDKFFDDLGIK
jgi:hypothetical protein